MHLQKQQIRIKQTKNRQGDKICCMGMCTLVLLERVIARIFADSCAVIIE